MCCRSESRSFQPENINSKKFRVSKRKKELESLVLKFGVSKLKNLVSMVVVEPYICVLFSHS